MGLNCKFMILNLCTIQDLGIDFLSQGGYDIPTVGLFTGLHLHYWMAYYESWCGGKNQFKFGEDSI